MRTRKLARAYSDLGRLLSDPDMEWFVSSASRLLRALDKLSTIRAEIADAQDEAKLAAYDYRAVERKARR